MTDLFWPGDERAGGLCSQQAWLEAMVRVESSWLSALVTCSVAPPAADRDLTGLVDVTDLQTLSTAAESSGNPVVPLVGLLRARLDDPAAAWVHQGLTSQDVLDTALMLCAHDVVTRLREEMAIQIDCLVGLVDSNRANVMTGRTLTQHAVPITFGLKAAQWLTGLLDAADVFTRLRPVAQFGGAAGTLAATSQLARSSGVQDPAQVALTVASIAATTLDLSTQSPWHTARAPITQIGDALASATDAWGRIANDVLVLARPEIGELAEQAGRGSSSTMPHKANPVLSVLIRRAALTAPGAAAQLHLAAAESVDERPDGSWHTEWATLATMARRAVVAGSQATELLAGLTVNSDRMAATARAGEAALLAEQRAMAGEDTTGEPGDVAGYLGSNDRLIDGVLDRARTYRERPS